MPTTCSTRLARSVVLIVAAVIVVSSACSFMAFRYALHAETAVRYLGLMNVVSERLSKTIRGMERNAMNVFDEVGKHLDSPDAVIAALKSKTNLNPDVRGYFAAFELDYFPEEGHWFEPYVNQRDTAGRFEVTMVGSARHDYTKSVWFVQAKERLATCGSAGRDTGFWSAPYFYKDDTGLNGHYCTYVKPVFNGEGRLACICGADMTLEWLVEELRAIEAKSRDDALLNSHSMMRHHDFHTLIYSNDGSCLAHSGGYPGAIKDEDVLAHMAQRCSGIAQVDVDGREMTMYYAPLEGIDWTVAVVVPHGEGSKLLLLLGALLTVVGIAGIGVTWLVCRKLNC